jgi:hypothetical protein
MAELAIVRLAAQPTENLYHRAIGFTLAIVNDTLTLAHPYVGSFSHVGEKQRNQGRFANAWLATD